MSQPFGSAIVLNGTTNFVSIPNNSSINLTNNITLEAWIKPCDLTGHNMIFTKFWCSGAQNAYYFTVLNGKLRWVWSLNACGGSGSIYESNLAVVQANVWQHVAVVHTSTGVTLYLNGLPVASTLTQGSYSLLKQSSQPLRIGTYRNLAGTYTLFFKGLIDEARMWNTNLTSANILSRYNGSLVGNEANLVAYYDMNVTGSGNAVTVTNGAISTGSTLNGSTVGSGSWPYFSSGLPIPNLGNDTTICQSANLVLDVTTSGGSYLWQDFTTNSTCSVLQSDTYSVELSVINGCINSDSIVVTMVNSPMIDFGNDTTLCVGQSMVLNASTLNGTYLWQNNTTDSTFTISQAGTYWVEVTTPCGIATDTITVGYFVDPIVNLGNDTVLCNSQSLVLNATSNNTTYLWQDNSTNPIYTVSAPGTYSVSVTNGCVIISDTLNVNYLATPTVNLGNDTNLCFGQNLVLNATSANVTYLWQDNSTNSVYNVSQAGTYSVDVTNGCGSISDTINVSYLSNPMVNLGNDTTLCLGQNLVLDATTANGTYLWQNNTTDSIFTVSQSGTYWVEVTTICGLTSDSVDVNFISGPSVHLGNDTVLCVGQSLALNVYSPNVTYIWQDNSILSSYVVTQSGNYWVSLTNACGADSDTINISYMDVPVFSIGNDTSMCDGDVLTLSVLVSNGVYAWQDGTVSNTYNVTKSGKYWVDVTNSCGTVRDEINVSYINLSHLDIGNDTVLCVNDILLLEATTANASYLWQDNSVNSNYYVNGAGEYWVEIRVGNCVGSDTIHITEAVSALDLGNDSVLCFGTSLLLDAGSSENAYLWQDNSTDSYMVIESEGLYWVEITNICGTQFDSINIDFEDCDCNFYIPNAFHPNDNDLNDFFKPVSICDFDNYEFQIFDRWGDTVFETNSIELGWDGKVNGVEAPLAIYAYIVRYYFKGESQVQIGTVTLVR